ncbi:DNA-binding response regulator [Desulfonema ishimotonii]|uniref:DNA-binding response regulator n=1 Tax=Desulfonema ishimotonii TaxID=45657 RepID=A0A401FY90_9BACT|nr:response regulator transcription factor [Desulfonema ishimotonii]GBC61972.1 DNA-binding response regulator [Desulfonema ishimotonii]
MKHTEKKRILIIEDEAHISEGLKLNLTLQGYDVEIAADGSAGLRKWKSWHPDLIVLDIMLPLIDGFSVLRNIRLEDEWLPVLILSAKSSADEKVRGFSYGVDDYLSKPFNLDEFLMRVERLLKRVSRHGTQVRPKTDAFPNTYTFGENEIDFDTATARCRMGTIDLTGQEVKLLKLFIANRGKPLSRARLLEIGWGYTHDTSTRTVDNFIVRFRKYFEVNSKKPVYFKSRRSVGYVFDHD